MLGYVSLAIGLCTIAVTLVFVITWLYLHGEIQNSQSLQEEFHSAARRMIASIGIFTIPVVVYFLAARKRFVNNDRALCFRLGCLLRREFIVPSGGFNHSNSGC